MEEVFLCAKTVSMRRAACRHLRTERCVGIGIGRLVLAASHRTTAFARDPPLEGTRCRGRGPRRFNRCSRSCTVGNHLKSKDSQPGTVNSQVVEGLAAQAQESEAQDTESLLLENSIHTAFTRKRGTTGIKVSN